jgi:hypothetical protein
MIELPSSFFTFKLDTGRFLTTSSSSSAPASKFSLCSFSAADSASVMENLEVGIAGLGQAVDGGRESAPKSGSSAMVAAIEEARSSSSEPIVNASALSLSFSAASPACVDAALSEPAVWLAVAERSCVVDAGFSPRNLIEAVEMRLEMLLEDQTVLGDIGGSLGMSSTIDLPSADIGRRSAMGYASWLANVVVRLSSWSLTRSPTSFSFTLMPLVVFGLPMDEPIPESWLLSPSPSP